MSKKGRKENKSKKKKKKADQSHSENGTISWTLDHRNFHLARVANQIAPLFYLAMHDITLFNAAVKHRGLHGFQQGVVMEGSFRDCGNIVAVKAAEGWKNNKTHEKMRHQCTKPDVMPGVKKVENLNRLCDRQLLPQKSVCLSLKSHTVVNKSYIIYVLLVQKNQTCLISYIL